MTLTVKRLLHVMCAKYIEEVTRESCFKALLRGVDEQTFYSVECILTINTVPKNRNLKDLLGSNFDSGLFSITVCAMASPKAIKDPEAKNQAST